MGFLAEWLGVWPFVEGGDEAWWAMTTFQNPWLPQVSLESSADIFKLQHSSVKRTISGSNKDNNINNKIQ